VNHAQLLSVALIVGAVAMFAWGRFRYDAIALGALVIAILTGDVPAKEAFTGFASEVVVIIASALVISAAIARSGVIEPILQPLIARFRTPAGQVPAMAATTAIFSMLTKNVGALATLMPVAVRLGRGKDSNVSALLMPMAFMSLLGGLVTAVGTSTNIIASEVREKTLGHPFALFDFAPVGLSLTALGLIFVSVGWRLLPTDRRPRAALSDVHAQTAYSTEARIPDDWPDNLAQVSDLALADKGVMLTGLLAANGEACMPLPATQLQPGMVLLLQGDDEALGALFTRAPLVPVREENALETDEASEELRTVEAVVEDGSPLVGQSAESAALQSRHNVKLLAISRVGERLRRRLQKAQMQPGDLIMLQGAEGMLAEALGELGVLPLAERSVTVGDRRLRYGPIVILAIAMALVAAKVLTIAVAFFTAAFLMVAIGSLTMREAYGALEPEVLILIGALTPLSEAVQHSGGTALIAGALSSVVASWTPLLVLGGMMAVAMACSPFLHNAPTVLVLAPLGVLIAQRLQLNPDAFLMAVATGAGCDFVTPIGHQCNTLVRGPGGYRFGDYVRLGAPLSLLVLFAGTPLIAYFWL
jgi:di/tricarboxylate transporter